MNEDDDDDGRHQGNCCHDRLLDLPLASSVSSSVDLILSSLFSSYSVLQINTTYEILNEPLAGLREDGAGVAGQHARQAAAEQGRQNARRC